MVADIHVYGDHVLKLYHAGRSQADPFIEASMLAIVATHNLPAPRVYAVGQYGARWGLVMDRAPGRTLGEQALAKPQVVPACLDELVRLQLLLHRATETRLRPLKARLGLKIDQAPLLDGTLKQRLTDRLAALPDGNRICHGDFHPLNLIGEPGSCVIVDWLDTTSGPAAADACRSYLLLRQGPVPALADNYLDRYTAQSGIAATDILAWLPILAAARLTEGISEEEARLVALVGDP
jgi:aminoglycoside phosphotransferase (APT) family kinase protein